MVSINNRVGSTPVTTAGSSEQATRLSGDHVELVAQSVRGGALSPAEANVLLRSNEPAAAARKLFDAEKAKSWNDVNPARLKALETLSAGAPSPAPARVQSGRPATPAVKPDPSIPAGESYTVAKGDSLWSIAKHQLGDANRWKEIAALNPSVAQHPDRVLTGQKLVLPKTAQPATPTAAANTDVVASAGTADAAARQQAAEASAAPASGTQLEGQAPAVAGAEVADQTAAAQTPSAAVVQESEHLATAEGTDATDATEPAPASDAAAAAPATLSQKIGTAAGLVGLGGMALQVANALRRNSVANKAFDQVIKTVEKGVPGSTVVRNAVKSAMKKVVSEAGDLGRAASSEGLLAAADKALAEPGKRLAKAITKVAAKEGGAQAASIGTFAMSEALAKQSGSLLSKASSFAGRKLLPIAGAVSGAVQVADLIRGTPDTKAMSKTEKGLAWASGVSGVVAGAAVVGAMVVGVATAPVWGTVAAVAGTISAVAGMAQLGASFFGGSASHSAQPAPA